MKKENALTELKGSLNISLNELSNFERLSTQKNEITKYSYRTSSFSDFNFLAAHSYVIDNDPAAFRLWSYHAGLSTRSLGLMENGFDNILLSLSYGQGAILSDHYPLIRDIVNWKCKYHEESYKRGALFYIAQQLIAGDYEQADALWIKGKSHLEKKLNFFMEERRAMRALIDKDPEALKEALFDMLTPEMIKKNP